MNKYYYILLLLLLLSCNNNALTDSIRRLQSSPIDLCLDSLAYFVSEVDKQYNVDSISFYSDKNISMVVYMDSSSCSTCAIKSMYHWLGFLEEVESRYKESMKVYFVFAPRKDQMVDFERSLQTLNIEYPIFIDTTNVFLRRNLNVPMDKNLHTFLLDQKRRVRLVGNPLHNLKMMELVYSVTDRIIIEEREVNKSIGE